MTKGRYNETVSLPVDIAFSYIPETESDGIVTINMKGKDMHYIALLMDIYILTM